MDRSRLITLASTITGAFLSTQRCDAADAPKLLETNFNALLALSTGDAPAVVGEVNHPEAAVTVRKSLANPDFILSMIDGKPYKTLRRHLGTHNYTPESYRAAFDLKPDYPMVAANYSRQRREMALKIGLGTSANRGA